MLLPKRFHPSSPVAYPLHGINQEHSDPGENIWLALPRRFSGSNIGRHLRPNVNPLCEEKMLRLGRTVTVLIVSLSWLQPAGAQTNTATHVSATDVTATLKQGETRLAEPNRTISDLVIRHSDVGEGNLGVSVVQRTSRRAGGELTGIAHVELDEIYYVVSGSGTLVTGGMLDDKQVSHSDLLGPMERGRMRGGDSRLMNPGDIAIIPKGVSHAWSEITTDTIDYLVFRNDPAKVMQLK